MVTKLTFMDLISKSGSIRSSSGAKKLDIDSVLPFLILPVLLLIATISLAVTVGVMVIIGMGTLYVISRPRQKNRSPFFYSWTLASGVYMHLVYQFEILGMFLVTMLENFVFTVLLLCTCYFFYKMKAVADFELATGSSKGKEYSPVITSDSHYCQICQIEVNERYFHSIWWDCCVFRPNYRYFVAGQLFAFATLLHGSNLGLTTACHPILWNGILLPADCNHVYENFTFAISFATCVYGVGYLLVITLVLVHQILVYIPKYYEPQWKKLVNVLNV